MESEKLYNMTQRNIKKGAVLVGEEN